MAINTAVKMTTYNKNANNNGNKSCEGDLSQCRRRLFRSKVRFQAHFRKEGLVTGVFLRRSVRYLMVLSFLYVLVLIMCVGPFSAFLGRAFAPRAVYRSPELFAKLWPDIAADNSTAIQLASVWKYKRRLKMQRPRPCPSPSFAQRFTTVEESSGPSGYLIVEANGGLNQQRSAICNAVAVAGLLNAVLVIPRFDFNNVWRDPSEFQDIYDQDHFIATLEGHVKVVKELPEDLMRRYDYNVSNITNFHINAWAPSHVYLREVYPVLREQGVIRIAPFANRLAMNVPLHIQFLRCITNYKALRFSPSISELAQKLVNRMIEKSSFTGGKFVAVHLRFEEDMVAFSCCVYDGGDIEKFEMDSFRERGWKKKFKKHDISFISGQNRINGKCPLTPLEVGMMLRGMGFDNNTSIYLASGQIYQAERHLAPLLKMFPLLYSKESLATPDELAPFKGYSSRLAALDYSVCLFSEVFVTTQGGNFPHFLMGHRRFLFEGHAKTIKPDKTKIVLLLQNMKTSWSEFKNQTRKMLAESDRKGMIVPRLRKINRKNSIYSYPLPECECLQSHNSSALYTRAVNILDPQSSRLDDKQSA